MGRKIKWGVIGSGGIARRRTIPEGLAAAGNAELAVVYDVNAEANAWRQDATRGAGGALVDLGGHCIDLLEMFFGPVTAVSCATARRIHDYPVEDSAIATLHFANGALGVVDTFFCIRDESSRNVLELYGSCGSIHASGTIGQGDRGEMVARLLEDGAAYDAQQARAAGTALPISPPPVNMYRAEIEEFSQAILDGREPVNNAQLGDRSQQVLAACYESARSGARVALN